MGFLTDLFGNKVKAALRNGAIVIDVRSGTEYDRGHVPDAFNIPVNNIQASADRLKAAKRPIVICCSSGDRSSKAVELLKAKGVKEVYNGGSWEKVLRLMKEV